MANSVQKQSPTEYTQANDGNLPGSRDTFHQQWVIMTEHRHARAKDDGMRTSIPSGDWQCATPPTCGCHRHRSSFPCEGKQRTQPTNGTPSNNKPASTPNTTNTSQHQPKQTRKQQQLSDPTRAHQRLPESHLETNLCHPPASIDIQSRPEPTDTNQSETETTRPNQRQQNTINTRQNQPAPTRATRQRQPKPTSAWKNTNLPT